MNIQLIVAAQHDALERPVSSTEAIPHCTSIVLNGELDEISVRAISETIAHRIGLCDSIVVTLEHVVAAVGPLEGLAANVMRFRSAGSQIQLTTRDRTMYDRLLELPDSRDWLIGFADGEVSGVRRAIHLDGPRLDAR